MPAWDVRVDAVFEEIESYHVTVVGGTADKEAAGENEYKAEPGDTIKITAYAPGSNQKFVGWEVKSGELSDTTSETIRFNLSSGLTASAIFEKQ
jgi:protein involved in polysaccharide export with SLBB domain